MGHLSHLAWKSGVKTCFYLIFYIRAFQWLKLSTDCCHLLRLSAETGLSFLLDPLTSATVVFSLQSYGGRCRLQVTASGLAAWKNPAAFRDLCQIGYSIFFHLPRLHFVPSCPPSWMYRKNSPDARSHKASNKREKNKAVIQENHTTA